MKLAAKLTLGLAAVAAAILVLFLLPVVSISLASMSICSPEYGVSSCPPPVYPGSASMAYAWFGIGAVYVPSPPGLVMGPSHSYCLMDGNPGTMCGYAEHMTMNG